MSVAKAGIISTLNARTSVLACANPVRDIAVTLRLPGSFSTCLHYDPCSVGPSRLPRLAPGMTCYSSLLFLTDGGL